jgi:hypothetical protein
VPGAVLEFAVDIAGRHLLFLTDDVPHEEVLSIVLLDAGFQLLDSATIGRAYHTGCLRTRGSSSRGASSSSSWATAPGRSMYGRRPAWAPFVPDAAGVGRPFGLHRHFIVSFKPG